MCEHEHPQDQKRQTVEEFLKESAPDDRVITVTVDGGMVSWVDIPDGSEIRVLVKDYDMDGCDETDLCVDDNGDECAVTLWSDRLMDREADSCAACGGRGWILSVNTDRRVTEIQRCDTCRQYDSDEQAAKAAVPLLEAGLKMVEQSQEEPHGNTDKE